MELKNRLYFDFNRGRIFLNPGHLFVEIAVSQYFWAVISQVFYL